MTDKLEVGKSYTIDELLNMFPQSEGNLYIGWDELEEGNQYD
jgi:hypothetical protein